MNASPLGILNPQAGQHYSAMAQGAGKCMDIATDQCTVDAGVSPQLWQDDMHTDRAVLCARATWRTFH